MVSEKIKKVLSKELGELKDKGSLKGEETVITGVKPAYGEKGPRCFIEGHGDREFLKMNSNSYLGMGLKREVIEAEEKSVEKFGVGPGAVRFISGTYNVYTELEKRLARFHNKEAGMLFSSAYATVMGILPSLISKETIVISDELNHNCIINAIRLSRPKDKKIYKHNDMQSLESVIKESVGNCKRVVMITDGVFSMRGDNAPLKEIANLAERYNSGVNEGIITIIDDSHGVGAIGERGRGTTEFTNEHRIDIIISTMGKGLGVNGGYVVSDAIIIEYLREKAPFYIYSNPFTPGEASAALAALEILDSNRGIELLKHLHEMTSRFEKGLIDLGFEVIKGAHPVVPLITRDTEKTMGMVNYLKENGVLTTGLTYPVVPRGEEEIRFQISSDHTVYDIDYVLGVLKKYKSF